MAKREQGKARELNGIEKLRISLRRLLARKKMKMELDQPNLKPDSYQKRIMEFDARYESMKKEA